MADENDAAEAADEVIDAPEAGTVEEGAKPELTEVEQLASEMGWRPKEEWSGAEAEWKPATDFLKATRDINRGLSRDVKDMKRQIEGITRASSQMTERAVAAERERWEAEMDRAVDEGDKDAVKAARAKLSELDRQPSSAPEATPEAAAFVERHSSWWGKDREATDYAMRRCEHYAEQGLSPARQLAIVEREMKAAFPDLFEEEKPRKPAPAVGTPQRAARTAAREKGYATLPPAARKACDEWVSRNGHRGKGFAKEDWAKSYYEDHQEAANG